MIWYFLFVILLANFARGENSTDDLTACNGGKNFNKFCCLDHKEAWFTELVELDNIAFIQIEPYSCANPSYCAWHVTELGDLIGGPDNFFDGGFYATNEEKQQLREEWEERHYSGAGLSCGPITFILCENTGEKTWMCYAKVDDPSVTVIFPHALKCDYVERNGTTFVQIGSCVINQETRPILSPEERIYADLSSNTALPYMPILNPSAVDVFRHQRGINKVVRKSDGVMMSAYLPIPQIEDIAITSPTSEATDNIFFSRNATILYSCQLLFSLFCICGIELIYAFNRKNNELKRLERRVTELENAKNNFENDEEMMEDEEMIEDEELTFVPVPDKT